MLSTEQPKEFDVQLTRSVNNAMRMLMCTISECTTAQPVGFVRSKMVYCTISRRAATAMRCIYSSLSN